MSNNQDEDFLEPFNQFLVGLDKHTPKEKLFLLAGFVELLRHTKSGTDLLHTMELLANVQNVDWARIPFSITKTVLSDKYADLVRQTGVPESAIVDVIQTALLLFLDEMWANTPAVPTEARLQEIVKTTAAEVVAVLKPRKEPPPQNPKFPVVSPDIFTAKMIRRVFEPQPFTPELATALGLNVVTYRGKLANGSLGPTCRGIAFSVEPEYHVLLETGEYVVAPPDYAHVSVTLAAEEYKNLSPVLLLALVAAADVFESFGLITPEQSDAFKTGKLGSISEKHFLGVCDADDLRPLEHVFDIGREAVSMGVTGATGPTGASVRFPVPAGQNMAVVLDAQQDTAGPYSVARLVKNEHNKDTVLMRHEVPRLYSLRGVYLFPLQDRLVSLTGIG